MENEVNNAMPSLTLDDIAKSLHTSTREVEFVVAGQHTGWFFELRHESSEEVQEMLRQFHAKVRESTLKRKTAAYQNLAAAHEDNLRVAHVAGWRWAAGVGEGRPPFSKKALREVLAGPIGWHVGEFIDQEVGSLEDFLDRSDSN